MGAAGYAYLAVPVRMYTPVFVDPEISTQADGAQSSRVPVSLPEDPYEAISTIPACHVEESEDSDMSGARSTSWDSTTPLSPDHPLTNATPVLVPSLHRTTPFCKRFRSSYESSPSPSSNLIVQKRYRGHELDDESHELDDKSHELDDKSCGIEDESHGLNDEGRRVESDRLGLEEEAALEGQQRAAPVVETAVGQGSGFVPEPERPERVSVRRQPTITTWTDSEDGRTYIDIPTYPPPAPPVQTPPSPEWPSGSLLIYPAPFAIPSPMISLTVPSTIASPVATLTTTIPVNEDQFIEIDMDVKELYNRSGAVRDAIFSQRYRLKSLEHEQERTAMTLVHDLLVQQATLQSELQEMRGRVTALEQERDRMEQ
ncbi:hypothetical protein Tco_1070674 [Tanacetum coccineum]|uniref:Uncharacterized protein n=1 Tax=Tanacetum coccineum TaxID=301880 RepID=A0ABQ5HNT4_9ASTR